MSTRGLERLLYLTQRALGDARAASCGHLGRRLARRRERRWLWRLFKSLGL